jgi:peptidoglycan/xylan/chitin deacetylase (PgdA/CDA1 family)
MRVIALLFHDVYVTHPRESGFASAAADRYKLSARRFDAEIDGLARVRPDAPVLIMDMTGGLKASGHHLGRAGDDQGALPFLITVDDGGVSYYAVLADRLESRGWRGHCFVSTDAIGRPGFLTAAQIRELRERGHVIGSHSASHPARISACGPARLREEWTRSRQALEDLLGHEVTTASVPGGYYSRRVAHAARDAGLRVLFTSEPTTTPFDERGLLVVGRFTIRGRHRPYRASRLVRRAPWTRCGEWLAWNGKGVVKPLIGPLYTRLADWTAHAPQESICP